MQRLQDCWFFDKYFFSVNLVNTSIGERIIVHIRWRLGNLKKTYLGEVWQPIGIQKLAPMFEQPDVWTFKHLNLGGPNLFTLSFSLSPYPLVLFSNSVFACVNQSENTKNKHWSSNVGANIWTPMFEWMFCSNIGVFKHWRLIFEWHCRRIGTIVRSPSV